MHCLKLSKSGLRSRRACGSPTSRRCAAACRHGRGSVRAASSQPMVVLTREKGKNDKLMKALDQHGISWIEMPLIEHSDGPDRAILASTVKQAGWDWVTITSPEAAAVFIEAWEEAGKPSVRLAVVGGGTGEVLQQAGLKSDYVSTKALGKTLGGELPKVPGGTNRVLYPASAKASEDLQSSLTSSGFAVTRLNTYNTTGVKDVDPAVLRAALAAPVITFGSPSAVKAWVALAGLDVASTKVCACIGSTSARACEKEGLKFVYYPDSPGIEGWVDAILKGMKEHKHGSSATAAGAAR